MCNKIFDLDLISYNSSAGKNQLYCKTQESKAVTKFCQTRSSKNHHLILVFRTHWVSEQTSVKVGTC